LSYNATIRIDEVVTVVLSEHILEVDEATFEDEVVLRSQQVPVVVDFWAPWCAPCRMLTPILERQTIEAGGSFRLAKINVDENPGLAIRYGVQGIPAVKAFRDGEVVSEFIGAQPEAQVKRFINDLVPSQEDLELEEARSLLATRRWAEAEEAFERFFQSDDTSAAAALGLLKALLMQGKGAEALKLLDRFPAGSEWATAETFKPLARLLVEIEQESGESDPFSARLNQAIRLIARGNLPAAMDGLLDIMREDKRYRDDLPRKLMLALFSLLGDDDPVTQEYRQELASVLF
jgi:putative thioredoxin